MTTQRYTYHGTEDVHLPLQGILAKGGDTKTVYESPFKILHPDFEAVKEEAVKEEKAKEHDSKK